MFLVVIPPVGSPILETFDTPAELVREFKRQVRDASESMDLQETMFYAFIGERCELHVDAGTLDVIARVDDKIFRSDATDLDHFTSLERGMLGQVAASVATDEVDVDEDDFGF